MRRVMDTPIGPLTLVAGDGGLQRIDFGSVDAGDAAGEAGDSSAGEDHLRQALDQLGEYFDGQRVDFELRLDPHGSPFQLRVWEVLRTIPFGSTLTYGEQARLLGGTNMARAVGAANGRNPIPIVVPCHRVVGANGTLTGFAGGLPAKAWLLDHERAVIAGR